MVRKDRIDAFGAVSLVGFSLLLGFNQVVIKVVNEGMQPVFVQSPPTAPDSTRTESWPSRPRPMATVSPPDPEPMTTAR